PGCPDDDAAFASIALRVQQGDQAHGEAASALIRPAVGSTGADQRRLRVPKIPFTTSRTIDLPCLDPRKSVSGLSAARDLELVRRAVPDRGAFGCGPVRSRLAVGASGACCSRLARSAAADILAASNSCADSRSMTVPYFAER